MLQLPPSLGRLEWTRLNGTSLVAQQNGLAGPEGYSCCCKDGYRSVDTSGHLKDTLRHWARCAEGVVVVDGPGVEGSGVEVGALAELGCRPLLGSCSTCTSGGETQGFSLRVETRS